jgi:hypothetical protein
MVIQTFFFKYIVSKEFDVILEEKFNTIKYYISHDDEMDKDFKKFKEDYIKNNINKVKDQKQKRENINNKLYLYHCIIPILVVFILLIITLLSNLKGEWEYSTTLSILLVLGVYIPEVLIFLFVIKKYIHLGNINILTTIYKKLI